MNTGRSVHNEGIPERFAGPPAMDEFVNQVTDLGYNLVHESILPLEEVLKGTRRRGGVRSSVLLAYP